MSRCTEFDLTSARQRLGRAVKSHKYFNIYTVLVACCQALKNGLQAAGAWERAPEPLRRPCVDRAQSTPDVLGPPSMKTVLLFLGCALLSCGERGSSLRARSAGDLHCAPKALKIYRVDDRTYRVIGCQQEAVYISSCDASAVNGMSRGCVWIENSTRHAASAGNQPSDGQAVSTPTSAAGCSFDAQCKGDRICVNHECAAPAEPSATAR